METCFVTVTVDASANGFVASFEVVAPCRDMARRIWDGLDAYGLEGYPFTVTPHAGGHCK